MTALCQALLITARLCQEEKILIRNSKSFLTQTNNLRTSPKLKLVRAVESQDQKDITQDQVVMANKKMRTAIFSESLNILINNTNFLL
jgi:hypothetical protein